MKWVHFFKTVLFLMMKYFIRSFITVILSVCFALPAMAQYSCRAEDAATCTHQARRVHSSRTMHFQSHHSMRIYRSNRTHNSPYSATCSSGQSCYTGKRMSLKERHQLRRQVNQAGKSVYNE